MSQVDSQAPNPFKDTRPFEEYREDALYQLQKAREALGRSYEPEPRKIPLHEKIWKKLLAIIKAVWFWLVRTTSKVVNFLWNLPEIINKTHTRRVGIHNIVLVVFCFTGFVLSFLVLSQDIEEVFDDPSESNYILEVSPSHEFLEGWTATYNDWYTREEDVENEQSFETTTTNST
ncbi:unnamed protein product [Caenorhabditis nigoni]